MRSNTKILFSEGVPILIHWDNGIVINYKLNDPEITAFDLVIKNDYKEADGGRIKLKREKSGVLVNLHGENTDIKFSIFNEELKKVM